MVFFSSATNAFFSTVNRSRTWKNLVKNQCPCRFSKLAIKKIRKKNQLLSSVSFLCHCMLSENFLFFWIFSLIFPNVLPGFGLFFHQKILIKFFFKLGDFSRRFSVFFEHAIWKIVILPFKICVFCPFSSDDPQHTDAWIVASETCCFKDVGAKSLGEVLPGEIVKLTRSGITSVNRAAPQLHVSRKLTTAFCVFEYVYFARGDTIFEGEKDVHITEKNGTCDVRPQW